MPGDLRESVTVELLGGALDGRRYPVRLHPDGKPPPYLEVVCENPTHLCAPQAWYQRAVSDRPEITWVYQHITAPDDAETPG